jgi:flagellar basal-body rod protein FlgG
MTNAALHVARTGLDAQNTKMQVIANNLANVNTTGFKKSRADYQDLLYQEMKSAGASSSPSTMVPTGIEIGQGVRTVSTEKLFNQGSFKQTENPLDIAIEGEGFFQVTKPDGLMAYTRTGEFKVDSEGRLVTSDGYTIEPQITIPSDAMAVTISADGIVSVTQPGIATPTQVGNLELARFINPSGLQPLGRNLYTTTAASGEAMTGTPGTDGAGTLAQGFLEMSNVSVVEEMVNMIAAQRAYEINSKSIQTTDEMLQTANSMKR